MTETEKTSFEKKYVTIDVLAKFAATALGPIKGFQGAKPLGRRRHIIRAAGGRGLAAPGPRHIKMRANPNVLDIFARVSIWLSYQAPTLRLPKSLPATARDTKKRNTCESLVNGTAASSTRPEATCRQSISS